MEIMKSILNGIVTGFQPIYLVPIVLVLLVYVVMIVNYYKSSYYQVTKASFWAARHDVGRCGEYLTYHQLKSLERQGAKFLFNVYILKQDGETTEIDVLMICRKGIFVFESKNYSGWIFGSEGQKNWYQTLPQGKGKSRKEHFFNPIMQNRSHIKHLKTFLGGDVLMHSVIVFSERCTLKNVQVKDTAIKVIKRNEVGATVTKICKGIQEVVLAENEIEEIYQKLYPCTQVGEEVKKQHVEAIQNKLSEK